ncbi:helix-turn-helix domain-containing protein [Kribbella steppae]|uniref:helix-turn-helix domain-containing protein n=1 Tax=Kribbella steppae TaxID=2512223 RepID=UPI00104B822E|nr:helix-turn-helix domain-containing protein [Kribbella steppae]
MSTSDSLDPVRWATTDETMVALRKSRPTIYRYIREGRLVAKQIPPSRQIFISQASIDAVLAGARRVA